MSNRKILLVEDESIVAMDMSRRLRDLDFSSVESVASGEEALEYVKREKPALILMDIHLKGNLDGINTAEIIKETENIPIVFITAYSDEETLERAKLAEPYGYILKPFQEREIRSVIKIALYKHKIEKEIERAKLDAENANDAKSRFLNKISHELRTPLNSILGMTELALESPSMEVQKKYLRVIQKSGCDLLGIINTIINFSQIGSGSETYSAADFFLDELVEKVIENFRYEIEQKKLKINLEIDENGPFLLRGDCSKLERVLMNIFGNAVKFTETGYVAVKASVKRKGTDEGYDVRIQIDDTGCGIPEEEQSEIYKAFHQADNSTTRRYGGTGLGLAVVKELVEMLDGEITFVSKPDQGTSFVLNLSFSEPLEQLERNWGEMKSCAGLETYLIASDKRYMKQRQKQIQTSGLTVKTLDPEKLQDNRENFNIRNFSIFIIEAGVGEAENIIQYLLKRKVAPQRLILICHQRIHSDHWSRDVQRIDFPCTREKIHKAMENACNFCRELIKKRENTRLFRGDDNAHSDS